MNATFGTTTCTKCGYKHATHNVAEDGSSEFLLCHRCGYQKASSKDDSMEINGAGAFAFVSSSGVVGGGVFEQQATFFEKHDELMKSVQGAKLFYSEKISDGEYYLVNFDTKERFAFGEDDIICLEGVKKSVPTSNLKVTYTKE